MNRKPAEFNDIRNIVESSDNIWQPDLQLYNRYSSCSWTTFYSPFFAYSDIASIQADSCKNTNCVITSAGNIACIPPCIHTVRCSADFSTWPFDTQNCSLHIGTWINSGDEIDFRVSKTVIPESDLQSQNKLWKMLKASYTRHHGNYSSAKKMFVRFYVLNPSWN